MDQRVAFIDLDETLVSTGALSSNGRMLFLGKDREKEVVDSYTKDRKDFLAGDTSALAARATQKEIFIISSFEEEDLSKDPYITALRPHARQFLTEISNIFDEVNILTTGQTAFQSNVLKLHSIDHFFDNVYGKQEIRKSQLSPLTTSKNVILVDDNCQIGSIGWMSKMTSIGVITDEMHQKMNQMRYEEKEQFLLRLSEPHFFCAKVWQGDPSDNDLLVILQKMLSSGF